jgi:Transglycosylase
VGVSRRRHLSAVCAILLPAAEVHYVYFDRHNLPDLGPFMRVEFSTVGHIYDAGDRLFPQGGSTITQQLVRGNFLRGVTARENSYELRPTGLGARALSSAIGARGVNMLARKREEMRLSLWLEREMRNQFGSKQRAKEEILARYATFVYMGHGQYGFARAAEYCFGRRLAIGGTTGALIGLGIPEYQAKRYEGRMRKGGNPSVGAPG